jgi:NAD(P)H-dependent FMN reductase
MKAVAVTGPDFMPRLFAIGEPIATPHGVVVDVIAPSVNDFDRAAVRGRHIGLTDLTERKTTMTDINVLALVGSLRAASVNRQIAQVASENGPDGISVAVYDGLGDIPFYNEDIDGADAPAAAQSLRAAVADADAVLVITPEYNASIPAVVKNAIDWLSRPYGEGVVTAKPLAVIGASGGRYGGVWAHDETRKSFGGAGARVVDAISLSIPISSLDGKDPRASTEVVDALAEVLKKLAAEVG